jgi:hypothetical protein
MNGYHCHRFFRFVLLIINMIMLHEKNMGFEIEPVRKILHVF